MAIDFVALGEQLERVHSPRLALRHPALCDAWPLFQATRNTLFNRYLLWDQPDDDLDVIDRMDAIIEATRQGKMVAVSAVIKTTGEWIGLFKYQPYATASSVVEMGVWMHDKFWHGRYALELGRACVDAAFALSGVDTLIGAAAPGNRSSRRLMELCGLRPTHLVLRQCENGAQLELQEFSLSRAERRASNESAFWQVQRPHLNRRTTDSPDQIAVSRSLNAPSGNTGGSRRADSASSSRLLDIAAARSVSAELKIHATP